MNPTDPPDPTDLEWELQERGRDEERIQAPPGDAPRLNRYRLIARALHEPLAERLPRDFASTVAAAAETPLARNVLVAIALAWLAAMTAAVLVAGSGLTHALSAIDGPIVVMALGAVLSQLIGRMVGLMRVAHSPLHFP